MPSILIVGGTRGLGSALVSYYTSQSSTEVFATSRQSSAPSSPSKSNLTWLPGVDLMKPTCGSDLASQLQGKKVSTIIITAGVFLRESFDEGPNWDNEVKMYHTSSIAPPFLVSALVKSKSLSTGAKVVLVSSEAGSITLRTEGGGDYAHHASKAALNMVGKQLSYDLKPLDIAVAIVHPSFMRTEMTKGVGFDSAWDDGGALYPDEAAKILGDWVDQEFDISKTGEFWAPRGTRDIGSWNDVYGKETQKVGPVQLPWSSLATTLGLRPSALAPTPSYTAHYIIFNFLFAYAALSTRWLKNAWGLDHNVCPREDVTKYGEAAVKSGKITARQLDMLKRNEGAHANAVDHFPVFVGALLWAHQTGLSTETINATAAVYTVVRLAYAALYVFGETLNVSWVRSVAWWVGNVTCLRLFWLGGKALNRS